MKLYSPIITNNEIYLECELQRVKAGTISNCKKIMDDNNFPLALLSFVIDGIKSFKTKDGNIIEERIQIKSITSRMRQKYIIARYVDKKKNHCEKKIMIVVILFRSCQFFITIL